MDYRQKILETKRRKESPTPQRQRGTMIVELMVALFIISTTMVLLVGTFMSAQKSYRANNASADVAAELAFLLEDISREARVSERYVVSPGCSSGGPCTMQMTRKQGINAQSSDEVVVYTFGGGRFTKNVGGTGASDVTSTNVTISRVFAAKYGGTGSEPSRIFLSITAQPTPAVLGAGDTTVQTTLTSRFD